MSLARSRDFLRRPGPLRSHRVAKGIRGPHAETLLERHACRADPVDDVGAGPAGRCAIPAAWPYPHAAADANPNACGVAHARGDLHTHANAISKPHAHGDCHAHSIATGRIAHPNAYGFLYANSDAGQRDRSTTPATSSDPFHGFRI